MNVVREMPENENHNEQEGNRQGLGPGEQVSQVLMAIHASAWQNIQHNEHLRNSLLATFVVIASGLLAVMNLIARDEFQAAQPESITIQYVALSAAVVVGLVGLTFIWVFLRFAEMISRDNVVISKTHAELTAMGVPATVLSVYGDYRRHSQRILQTAPVTTAFTVTVGILSVGVVSTGIYVFIGGDALRVLEIVALTSLFYVIISMALSRSVRIRP